MIEPSGPIKFKEWTYYFFGLRAGMANLLRNGLALGAKKTLGKIFQPVNHYGRFPEFYFTEQWLHSLKSFREGNGRAQLLDVGSPKLIGLYLAYHYPVKIWLTDISPLNVDEYRVMWRALSPRARGEIVFEIQDGRSLTYPDRMFDGVYSLSVLEHIEGEGGDSRAVAEMMRVLKDDGRIMMSVPFGSVYAEQTMKNREHAVIQTKSGEFFFQRIYDFSRFSSLVDGSGHSEEDHGNWVTIWRREGALLKTFHWLSGRLSENILGLFGFLNPWLSRKLNRSGAGHEYPFFSRYTGSHSRSDIYGDLVWLGEKSNVKHADRV